jgi:hypothetical protein
VTSGAMSLQITGALKNGQFTGQDITTQYGGRPCVNPSSLPMPEGDDEHEEAIQQRQNAEDLERDLNQGSTEGQQSTATTW